MANMGRVFRGRAIMIAATVLATFAALGAPAAAAAPPRVAVAPPSAAGSSNCPLTALIIGLHGMGEGPSPQDPGSLSPEIDATFTAFDKYAPRSAWEADFLDYPTLAFDWKLGIKIKDSVQTGVKQLEARIAESLSSCRSTPISLVGYSEGALIINTWMQAYSGQLKYIHAVVLYGDPCWDIKYGTNKKTQLPLAYRGLARIAIASGLPGLGLVLPDGDCGPPEPFYPYPGITATPPTKTFCHHLDPICGQAYLQGDTVAQAEAAIKCTKSDGCPHLTYQTAKSNGATDTTNGGKFLAAHAFRKG